MQGSPGNAGWDDTDRDTDAPGMQGSPGNAGWYDTGHTGDTADSLDTTDRSDTTESENNVGWYDSGDPYGGDGPGSADTGHTGDTAGSSDTDDRDTGNPGDDSGDTGRDATGDVRPSPAAGLDWDRLGWCAPEEPELELRRYRGAESPWALVGPGEVGE